MGVICYWNLELMPCFKTILVLFSLLEIFSVKHLEWWTLVWILEEASWTGKDGWMSWCTYKACWPENPLSDKGELGKLVACSLQPGPAQLQCVDYIGHYLWKLLLLDLADNTRTEGCHKLPWVLNDWWALPPLKDTQPTDAGKSEIINKESWKYSADSGRDCENETLCFSYRPLLEYFQHFLYFLFEACNYCWSLTSIG